MKVSTILVGTLAAFATAHVARTPEPEAGGLQDIVKQISAVPGLGAIKDILTCIKNDNTWKADWSQKNQGKVTFSRVSNTCCDKAQAGWTKYGDQWGKFGQAKFNSPCDGGVLSGMKEENVDKLQEVIGKGH